MKLHPLYALLFVAHLSAAYAEPEHTPELAPELGVNPETNLETNPKPKAKSKAKPTKVTVEQGLKAFSDLNAALKNVTGDSPSPAHLDVLRQRVQHLRQLLSAMQPGQAELWDKDKATKKKAKKLLRKTKRLYRAVTNPEANLIVARGGIKLEHDRLLDQLHAWRLNEANLPLYRQMTDEASIKRLGPDYIAAQQRFINVFKKEIATSSYEQREALWIYYRQTGQLVPAEVTAEHQRIATIPAGLAMLKAAKAARLPSVR